MASSRIKGITIEIDGNTTKLQDALKGVNKQVYGLNADLKDLNQALKLDPTNTQLLAQKQDVLKRAITETTNKLNTLKEAQRQMGDYNKLTDEQKSSYNALSKEIAKTENNLKEMNSELNKSSKINLKGLESGLKAVADVAVMATKELLKVSAAIGGALTAAVAAGVKSYAQLEQNMGGVETLFGKDAEQVIKNAEQAYKTAGVSANEYMQGVTSFSASLLQSLGGDTQYAAEVADMAFRDMSDNANKFGTDMQSIQNAYQGFAKQNYTMLDNLKLGYGGTKTEMERLLKDAQRIKKEADGVDIKFDIKKLSDVYEAIHIIQEEMGVTGTTAEEAEKTISGSFASMKASLDNFLNGTGSPEELATTITNVLSNIGSAIEQLAPNILSGITNLATTLIPQVATLILNLLPQLMDAIGKLIDNILNEISNNTDGIKNTITALIQKTIQFITENLPKIIQLAIVMLKTWFETIQQNMPMVYQAAMDILLMLIQTITDNLDQIVIMAIDIMLTIQKSMIGAIPQLVDKLPEIIVSIVEALTSPEMLTKMFSIGPVLILELAKALIKSIPTLLTAVPEIMTSLVNDFINWIKEGKLIDLGKDIIQGIIDGLLGMWDAIKEACGKVGEKIKEGFEKLPDEAKNWGADMAKGLADGLSKNKGLATSAASGIASGIKKLLHFSRPDEGPLRDYEEWMPDFMQGLANGINKNAYLVQNAMGNLVSGISTDTLNSMNNAMSAVGRGIENSINPTINPNITIDTNYRMMALAMKEALKDMDIELDDREVGRFVVKTVEQEIYS